MANSPDHIGVIQREAAKGDARAQWTLGWMYLKGAGLAPDAAKALEWYEKAAKQGHASAQNSLRIMYYKGVGGKRDIARSAEWAMKAAESGHVEAQANLGAYYLRGLGVPKDTVMGYAWLLIAHEYGCRSWHTVTRKLAEFQLDGPDIRKAHEFVGKWQAARAKKLNDKARSSSSS